MRRKHFNRTTLFLQELKKKKETETNEWFILNEIVVNVRCTGRTNRRDILTNLALGEKIKILTIIGIVTDNRVAGTFCARAVLKIGAPCARVVAIRIRAG